MNIITIIESMDASYTLTHAPKSFLISFKPFPLLWTEGKREEEKKRKEKNNRLLRREKTTCVCMHVCLKNLCTDFIGKEGGKKNFRKGTRWILLVWSVDWWWMNDWMDGYGEMDGSLEQEIICIHYICAVIFSLSCYTHQLSLFS